MKQTGVGDEIRAYVVTNALVGQRLPGLRVFSIQHSIQQIVFLDRVLLPVINDYVTSDKQG